MVVMQYKTLIFNDLFSSFRIIAKHICYKQILELDVKIIMNRDLNGKMYTM